MIGTDKTLRCFECENIFTSPAEEQEYFRAKGYFYEPKRCPACSQAKKAHRTIGIGKERKMYPVVCAECNTKTKLAYEPHDDTPVYCNDCYSKGEHGRY